LGWFYFLLHITIKITNCNSLTSDVGNSLLPRLSDYELLMRLMVTTNPMYVVPITVYVGTYVCT
jgi:hypothetical protein